MIRCAIDGRSRSPAWWWVDRGGAVLMLAGLSMPTFLVGLLLIYFLFFRLGYALLDPRVRPS